MADDPLLPNAADPADSAQDPKTDEPDTVATPEGDNEYLPGEPLEPLPKGLQRFPAIDTNKGR